MRTIKIFDSKDYQLEWNKFKRDSARAIIFVDDKLAMIKSVKYGEYKFPGGGIEKNESHLDTLMRETKEETGLHIVPISAKEYGKTVIIRKSTNDNEIFEQESYYYLCDIEDGVRSLTHFDEGYETEYQYNLVYVTLAEAIEDNKKLLNIPAIPWVMRDLEVLLELQKIKSISSLKTVFYFVRHAEPNLNNYNDMERELTEKGLIDSLLVTEFLSSQKIDIMISSPFKRAIDTISDFAKKNALDIDCINDFRERRISNSWIEDFNAFAKKQWDDFNYKLPDGESLMEVQERNIKALMSSLKEHSGKHIVVGSHGTALSTIINYFDKSFGYNEFNAIINLMPWIVKFTFDTNGRIEIETIDLFEGVSSNAI